MDALRNTLRRYLVDEPYRRLPPDDLWARFRDGRDEAAFRVLLERVGGRVYTRCKAVLRDDALAEDAFQEAFVAWVRHRDKLPTYAAAVAWLYRAATSTAKTHRRWRVRLWRREAVAAAPAGAAVEPPDGAADRERADAVAAAVARLPDRERRAIELVYLEGLTHDQAAAALGWTRGAVSSYVGRGLGRLQRAVGGKLGASAVGLAAVEATLRAAPPVVPPQSAAAWADVVLVDAVAGPSGWLGGWLPSKRLAAVVLVGGGVAVGLARVGGRPGPVVPVTPPQKPVIEETVPERNLRIFRAEVLPAQVAALRPVALSGGDVELVAAHAHDTRLWCEYRIRHRLDTAAGWASGLRFRHNTADHWTDVELDPLGRGEWRPLDTKRPIILWRNPVTRGELLLPVAAFEDARLVFARLPKDDRTAAERLAHVARVERALDPYVGTWYVRGDAARRCRVWVEDAGRPDGSAQVEFDTGGRSGAPLARLRLGPQGQVHGLFGVSSVTPDGRRLRLTEPDEWWSRDPR